MHAIRRPRKAYRRVNAKGRFTVNDSETGESFIVPVEDLRQLQAEIDVIYERNEILVKKMLRVDMALTPVANIDRARAICHTALHNEGKEPAGEAPTTPRP